MLRAYVCILDDNNSVVEIQEQVVRCQACKHYYAKMCCKPDGDGGFLSISVDPLGFCSDGELADDNIQSLLYDE